MSKANEQQVGGQHYRTAIQHWDYVLANDLGYFEAQITKYVTRWRKKNGLEDLKKARHFLEKLIEVTESEQWDRINKATDDSRAAQFGADEIARLSAKKTPPLELNRIGEPTSRYVGQ